MTSLPPPPDGWAVNEVVPQSQQQAQDTILGYLQKTVDALPPGTMYDSGVYSGNGRNMSCDDDFIGPGQPPTNFTTVGDLVAPDLEADSLIAKVGDIWRSWGWYVFERDGFRKPNQFGYGPDGYRLQIVVAYPPEYPPAVNAMSPCFPGDIARDDVAFPRQISSVRN